MLNQDKMPGAGSIGDTLEFMRKMWGSMGAPAMGIPSLSVEEINKKIADLKTVASWLELNMNMLRATIQTMEVQSATLSTLQAMGAILTPQSTPADAAPEAEKEAPVRSSFANWPQPASAADHESAAAEQEDTDLEAQPEDGQVEPEPAAQAATSEASAAAEAISSAPAFQAAMTNPNAWWNLLQQQFQQAVGNVLAEQEPAPVQQTATVKSTTAPGKTGKTATKTASRAASPAKAKPKKTTKPKAAAKPDIRAKSTVVQSRQPKSGSRKPPSL